MKEYIVSQEEKGKDLFLYTGTGGKDGDGSQAAGVREGPVRPAYR